MESISVSGSGALTRLIELQRRRIYILPSNYGWLYAAMLVIMFLSSINYNNSMGFALTFLLLAVALNSMWRTHDNILGLRIRPLGAEPVFAGQTAYFGYRVENPSHQPRYNIVLQWADGAPVQQTIPADQAMNFKLALPSHRRGLLPGKRIRLSSRYPLGLFQAWSWLEFEQTCLVYPKPQGRQALPSGTAADGQGMTTEGSGRDDFNGLRTYMLGDSPRHIAWKSVARSDELLVKRFSGQASPKLWLRWQDPVNPDPEHKLSQLCCWVLQAEAEGWEYGLQLPGLELPLGHGAQHRRPCLQALALFDISATAGL